MRAITIWQPWASAIALGLKRFETRSWPTSYRGPILIHAAARGDREHGRMMAFCSYNVRATLAADAVRMTELIVDASTWRGVGIAVGELVDCRPGPSVRTSPLERSLGKFDDGFYAWKIDNVVKLDRPILARGMQGLWVPPADVVGAVKDQVTGILST
jgi:hypothetical protein